jgi:hypothetical protein
MVMVASPEFLVVACQDLTSGKTDERQDGHDDDDEADDVDDGVHGSLPSLD